MPAHRGLEVHVQIDNQNLEEFQTTVSDDGKTVTCYIASQEDKDYVLFYDLFPERGHIDRREQGVKAPHYRCKAILDGVPQTRTIVSQSKFQQKGVHRGNFLYPFRFGKLDLDAQDEDVPFVRPSQASALQELSTIKVEVTRVAKSESFSRDQPWVDAPPELAAGNVPKKKGAFLSHRSVLGDGVAAPPRASCHCVFMDNEQPIVTFVFRYRSRALLEADDIIPFVPTEADAAADNDADAGPEPPRNPRRNRINLQKNRSTTPIQIDEGDDITIDLTAETESFTVTRRKRESGASSSSVVKRVRTRGDGGVVDLVKRETSPEEVNQLRERVRFLESQLSKRGGEGSGSGGSGSGSGGADGAAGPAVPSSLTA
ncbi:uncharacterized protein EV422DRAFT_527500 [Fimicolochytrium jonesii]|uniref:uncharacterized protein n=1 Tax=Fimicolochytrium jonesii TaxID=1396493 RepID=UPI0022FEA08A|nr:uncharacterized protein EV422DRAFT_527500 [Fimicolochytrium jonesii]KAI8821277.1 hypothetical protein EV422DRAFT_527500 [Fimicolochytrium jonesii]